MTASGNNKDTMEKKTEKGREQGELWVGTQNEREREKGIGQREGCGQERR